MKKLWMQLSPVLPSDRIHVLASVEEAIRFLHTLHPQVEVLVTGSLHLVGALFRALHVSIDMA
jgi:folylpolyglutamate synthase/dihydropteroate synthase